MPLWAHEPESCVSAISPLQRRFKINGGVDRVRTDDPHNAIVMLFQLSYNPIVLTNKTKNIIHCQYFYKTIQPILGIIFAFFLV